MTLILALGCRDYVCLLSDRRLSGAGGLVLEEQGKTGAVTCNDARLVFGFTGLALTPGFETRSWLLDTLFSTPRGERSAVQVMNFLTRQATRDFAVHPALRALPPEARRLSILFAGYVHRYNPPLLVFGQVSNCYDAATRTANPHASDKFVFHHAMESEPRVPNPVMIDCVGMDRAVTQDDKRALAELLQARKPATALVGKARCLMLDIADRPAAASAIGKQITWSILPASRQQAMVPGYCSTVATNHVYMPSLVNVDDDGAAVFDNVQVWITNDTNSPGKAAPAMVVPKVGRNAPCPCRSGKKYKRCHGRSAPGQPQGPRPTKTRPRQA